MERYDYWWQAYYDAIKKKLKNFYVILVNGKYEIRFYEKGE